MKKILILIKHLNEKLIFLVQTKKYLDKPLTKPKTYQNHFK
jgi:hypothetical protein